MEQVIKANDLISNLCGVSMVAMLGLIYVQLRDLSEKLAVAITRIGHIEKQISNHEMRLSRMEAKRSS